MLLDASGPQYTVPTCDTFCGSKFASAAASGWPVLGSSLFVVSLVMVVWPVLSRSDLSVVVKVSTSFLNAWFSPGWPELDSSRTNNG
jgi:hypothetical protein